MRAGRVLDNLLATSILLAEQRTVPVSWEPNAKPKQFHEIRFNLTRATDIQPLCEALE